MMAADTLTTPTGKTVIEVPLVNPPHMAPGRTDIHYQDESTPATRAAHEERREQLTRERDEVVTRLKERADSAALASRPAGAPAMVDTLNLPWNHNLCFEINSPVARAGERGDMLRHDIAYRRGLDPEPRQQVPGYDSRATLLLLVVVVLLLSSFRHHSTFLKTFTQDLWSVRTRGNVFDDHTMSETRITVSLIMLLCVCEGILVYSLANGLGAGVTDLFGAIMTGTGIAAGYYLWQLCAYTVTAYAFGSKAMRRQWIKGFNASQALLGMALVIPAVVAMFNPASAIAMSVTAAGFYVVARIIFIFKGFRLFYDNLCSLVYFILYLCALEIAPIVSLFKAYTLYAGHS